MPPTKKPETDDQKTPRPLTALSCDQITYSILSLAAQRSGLSLRILADLVIEAVLLDLDKSTPKSAIAHHRLDPVPTGGVTPDHSVACSRRLVEQLEPYSRALGISPSRVFTSAVHGWRNSLHALGKLSTRHLPALTGAFSRLDRELAAQAARLQTL